LAKDANGFLKAFAVKAADVAAGLVKQASEVFGLKRKALDGIPVRVVNSDHPLVPQADPDFFADYRKGVTLGKALRRLWMTEDLASIDVAPDQEAALSAIEQAEIAMHRKKNKVSNTWFFGHAGTGKSSLAEYIAAKTGRPFFTLPCHAGTTANHFMGDVDVRSVGQGAEAQLWKKGLFAEGVSVPYAIVLIDELGRCDSTHLICLNAPLENRQVLIPEAGISEPFAKGVWVCAADNSNATEDENGIYSGEELDASIPSRFRAGIELDFLPPAVESRVLQKISGIDAATASEIVKIAGYLRKATEQGKATKLLPSLRDLESWAKEIMFGAEPVDAFETCVTALGIDADDKAFARIVLQDQFNQADLNLVGY
tara:strand:- start:640 stop:1752 length:1113 start_codon:yes stop_codon:yes gene_type:complete